MTLLPPGKSILRRIIIHSINAEIMRYEKANEINSVFENNTIYYLFTVCYLFIYVVKEDNEAEVVELESSEAESDKELTILRLSKKLRVQSCDTEDEENSDTESDEELTKSRDTKDDSSKDPEGGLYVDSDELFSEEEQEEEAQFSVRTSSSKLYRDNSIGDDDDDEAKKKRKKKSGCVLLTPTA